MLPKTMGRSLTHSNRPLIEAGWSVDAKTVQILCRHCPAANTSFEISVMRRRGQLRPK